MGFVAALVAVLALICLQAQSSASVSAAVAVQLGVVATTLFGVSGALCFYRAAAARDRVAGLIALVFLGPGTAWSWLAFVDSSETYERAAPFVGLTSAIVAIILLTRGLRAARWLEVFSGLGSLALALAAAVVRSATSTTGLTATVALLVALAAMTSLYGLLVDIEVSEHRSFRELQEARQRLAYEGRRTEDLLHDLRSGLLSIEAASGGSEFPLADPVRCEAARLRLLTARGEHESTPFDLIPGVNNLVATRRSSGVSVELHAPSGAMVHGDESELLSIVDNLLSNAVRHGRAPIVVAVSETEGRMRLTVSDAGDGVSQRQAKRVFHRGFSSHPDGAGLGLDRARLLARRNDAALGMEAGAAGGATFVLVMNSMLSIGAA